ncbi:MAG: acyl-CoA desaturase [Planctomycetota bacterium]|jgi:stearoyl-CoA desaturase (delta-9 desaturase)
MRREINWYNIAVLAVFHLLAIAAVVYMATVHFSWWTLGLGVLWFVFCGLSITGGYHRLFSHPTYRAAWPVRFFFLLFGAASLQHSALKWSADHREHHSEVDHEEDDPYAITRGFFWAHMGWLFFKRTKPIQYERVADLEKDPLVMFQHKYYVPMAILGGAVLPALLGMLWGDWLGALLVAGPLRLVVLWHVTWSINSVAHTIGTQPFSTSDTARDSWVTALVTLGEGYHNYHHRFPADYRNGVRWYHFDPTKWTVWALSKVGLVSDLKRVPDKVIDAARLRAAESRRERADAAV